MKLLVTTSTFPVSDEDKAPSFVKEQVVELQKYSPLLDVVVHAPHNAYSKSSTSLKTDKSYREVRFHYFWPRRYELLTGRGILPALKQHPVLYLQIPFFFVTHFFSLLWLTSKEKPDLIYAHWFTPQAISSALVSKLTNTPFIFTTHASDVSVLKKLPLSNVLVHLVCKRAKAYTAVSERTANKLISFFEPNYWQNNFADKLSVIPMGVHINASKLSSSKLDRAIATFKIPKGKEYILFLGRLAEKKGVSYLLDAFAMLPNPLRENLYLIIAGDGQLNKTLKLQAEKLGIKNVTFTGYVHGTMKEALLELADYVCLPSVVDKKGDSEGFPVVLMEALAAGKIVIASDSSGGELILNNKTNGFTFKEKSAQALAKRILKVVELDQESKKNVRENALRLAHKFDWKNITQKYAEILLQYDSKSTERKMS